MYNTSRHCQCNHVLTGQVQSTPVTSQLDVHTRICTLQHWPTLPVQPRPHHKQVQSTPVTSQLDSHTDMYNTSRHCQCNHVLTTEHVQSTPVTSQLDIHTRICTTLAGIPTLSVQPRPHRTSTVHASNEPARCLHTDMYLYNTGRHCQYNHVLTTGQVQSTPVTSQLDIHTRICTTLADIVSATTSLPQDKYSPRQ
ncbi:hypothetical protein J6590_099382 [Homalodisca vitripennis]|nr:hypothetical protein J6590_099382 [Homalodisca vitripennis]